MRNFANISGFGKLLFALSCWVVLSASLSVVNLGDGRYFVQISEPTPIALMELEFRWNAEARALCGHNNYQYQLEEPEIDDSKLLIVDRNSKKATFREPVLRVKLEGELFC